MQPPASLPSSFDMLIDDLFTRDDRPDGSPKPAHAFSINSLEAAWELGSISRGRIDPNETRPLASGYGEEGMETEFEAFLDPNRILLELGLSANLSEAAVVTLRREFALRNHPDRVPAELREFATQRMQIANNLMDCYIERLRKARG